MVTYLLLRDNKEQGPMRLEDLLEIGLKPYDLVWLPGKSAAWRYPSEIEELQAYAPAMEEQPFDRFYKKETETPAVPKPVQAQKKTYTTDTVPPPKTKFVAVTMPAGQKKVVPEKTVVTQKPQPAYDEYKAYMPANEQQVSEKKAASKTVHEQLSSESSMALQAEKIAGFTERYEKTYLQRKNKWNKRALLLKYGKVAAVAVMVLGIGVIFAFNIGKPEANPTILANNNIETSVNNAVPPAPVEENISLPVTEAEQPITEEVTNTTPPVIQEAQEEPVSTKEKMQKTSVVPVIKATAKTPDVSKPVNNKKSTDLPKTSSAKAVLDKQPAPTTTDTRDAYAYETYATASNGERSRKSRDTEGNSTKKTNENNSNNSTAKTNTNPFYEAPAEKPVTNNNSNNSNTDVKIVANEYKIVPFGGIRNLQLTVQNRSGEALEKVVVDVEYIKRGGGVFKTKTVEFKNIAPKSSSVLKIDDTNRGVDVAYHIRKVVK
jgi:hypothetical protein